MLRAILTKASKPVARASTTATATRAFHSPFAVLSSASAPTNASAPLTTPSSETATAAAAAYDPTHDPDVHVTPAGTRTYVVSTPDPQHTPYAVPSGAYPNSSPYAHTHASGEALSAPSDPVPAPESLDSSTSANTPAHPHTTSSSSSSPRRLPANPAGVGASAAVRFRAAPGAMHEMGGSNSGEGMEDVEGTLYPKKEDELPDVNPPPLSKEGEEFGKKGLKGAWKARK